MDIEQKRQINIRCEWFCPPREGGGFECRLQRSVRHLSKEAIDSRSFAMFRDNLAKLRSNIERNKNYCLEPEASLRLIQAEAERVYINLTEASSPRPYPPTIVLEKPRSKRSKARQ